VIDYLLKPFSFNRFLQAVNKAIEHIELKTAAQQPTITKPQSFSTIPAVASSTKDFMLIKADHKVHKVKYEDILYIQSMREYVAYYTTQGRIIALNSLKKLETELPNSFIRIHKSYIVASQKVTTLEGNQVYIGNEKLPIGNFYRDAVLKRIFS
jgi:DNA-binding LytR/AlgR family response regulator